MAVSSRYGISEAGPNNGATYQDDGSSVTIPATTAGTSATEYPFATGPYLNYTTQGGNLYLETLDATNVVQAIYGVTYTPVTTLAAATNLTLTAQLRRSASLGAVLTGSTAYTSVTLSSPLQGSMPSGQTIVLTNVSGNTQSLTTSAAVSPGATSIPVNSVTPANTYPVTTSMLAWVVGNQAFAGWLATASGTPQFQAWTPTRLPFLSGNTSINPPTVGGAVANAVNGGYINYRPGDILTFLLSTSSSTVSVPISVLSTNIV